MLVRLANTKTSKWLFQLLHWILPIVSLYFIFVLINIKSQNQSIINEFQLFFHHNHFLFLIIGFLGLTFLNLIAESVKWKMALQPFLNISLKESITQTLMAMASGFITPFRSGAILSRFFSNENTDKSQIINATLVMGFAQFLVTFIFGAIGLLLFFFHFDYYAGALTVTVLLSVLFVFILLKEPKQSNLLSWSKYNLNLSWNYKVFVVSFIRYLIFSLQYLFILISFGVDVSVIYLFSLITFTFFVNTIIPSGILGKIGIRELSGILIIGESTGFIIETSCVAFLIWMLNQALPALLGSGLHLKKII